jgi:predicted metal-dependent peptidase
MYDRLPTDGGCIMTQPRTIEEKLSRARTQLLLNQPFFGTLCLRLKLVPLPSFPTIATDGQRLVYNPAFVATLTPSELEGVLAHEVMHCALAHHCRRGRRDAQLWNQATDYAVNPILLSNGITLPEDGLVDPAFADLGAEEIYVRLLKRGQDSAPAQGRSQASARATDAAGSSNVLGLSPQSTSQQADPPRAQRRQPPRFSGVCDRFLPARPGGFGEVGDAVGDHDEPASPAALRRQMQEWTINAEQALCSAKAWGHEPGGVERSLEQARQSEHDWRAILRDFVATTNPSDYRWVPPNRRFVSSGLYLPSVERSGVGEIVIVVDTSGSIGRDELEQFAGEINAITSDAQPEWVHIVYCDAALQAVDEFGPSEAIKLSPKGGGGTDFVPPFTWVEENGILPGCLIYLTDLCCNSFPAAPDYPVLWVTASGRRAPFGETLRMSVAD